MSNEEVILQKLNEQGDAILRMERLLTKKIKEEEWISKDEAMELLNVGSRKLYNLVVVDKKIRVNRNPGKNIRLQYNLESIREYKANPMA